MKSNIENGILTVCPEADLAGVIVDEVYDILLQAQEEPGKWDSLEIDFTGVNAIDAKGAILLLGISRELLEKERVASIVNSSESMVSLTENLGMHKLFLINGEGNSND